MQPSKQSIAKPPEPNPPIIFAPISPPEASPASGFPRPQAFAAAGPAKTAKASPNASTAQAAMAAIIGKALPTKVTAD